MLSGFVFYMEEERDQKYEENFTNSVVLKKALKIYKGTANNCWSRMYQNKSVLSPRKNILALTKMALIVQSTLCKSCSPLRVNP